MFFIYKLVNNILFKIYNHMTILLNVLQVIGFQNSSGVFGELRLEKNVIGWD